jgi:hypothetical protein
MGVEGRVASPARLELATLALGKPCSIQLSYGDGCDGDCVGRVEHRLAHRFARVDRGVPDRRLIHDPRAPEAHDDVGSPRHDPKKSGEAGETPESDVARPLRWKAPGRP